MIRFLMRLRPLLPERLWRPLRDMFWRRYWKIEYQRQREQLGAEAEPLAGSERATLIEAIADRFPFRTVLEVGCGFGQNGTILGPLFPYSKFTGIDPSSGVVLQGQRILTELGVYNVNLIEGFGQDLSRFADNSFNLVFSCASLLYVSPEQSSLVLREMIRVVRRGGAILMLEQHRSGLGAEGKYYERGESAVGYGTPTGYWIRDYHALVEEVAPGARPAIFRVKSPVWPVEQWKQYGSLIVLEVA